MPITPASVLTLPAVFSHLSSTHSLAVEYTPVVMAQTKASSAGWDGLLASPTLRKVMTGELPIDCVHMVCTSQG